MIHTKKIIFAVAMVAACLCTTIVSAQQDTTKSKPKKQLFELSFGQSKLFISSSLDSTINADHDVVVPTNAILFFAEFRPKKIIRIPVFFSLATQPKHFIVNGVLTSERASPTIGAGIMFRAFRWNFGEQSALEFEGGPAASFLFKKGGAVQPAPLVAGRVRFVKREDFIMYIGSSYSFGINAFGLFYGTGYVF